MSGSTYAPTPIAPYVDATGVHTATFENVLSYFQGQVQAIYGADVYLENDSQDGQFIGVFASAYMDCSAAAVAAYNSFSPATAQGTGLSSVVKINGLQREISSASTVDVTIGGTAGVQIYNGLVGDANNYQWALPTYVVIPPSGSVIVTAACTTPGAITAGPGTVTKILTPTQNWQTVTNASAATPGAPVEDDAQLRQRQSVSTSLPAQSPLSALVGALLNLPGVQRLQPYENDTWVTDGNGVPPKSLALVIQGGDATAIATTIAAKKTIGSGTYGTTSVTVYDALGMPLTISFFVLALLRVVVNVSITPKAGYVATTGTAIQSALAAFVSGLAIGANVEWFAVSGPAKLSGDAATGATGLTQAQLDALAATYSITALTTCFYGGTPGTADLTVPFNQAAALAVSDVNVTVPV